ncbi:hypothetical protein HYX19_02225 [Candidatus Woesearchaeota archaeon]|nr:hypothetical protein [Candidatus Woesearchaeota archaeon]
MEIDVEDWLEKQGDIKQIKDAYYSKNKNIARKAIYGALLGIGLIVASGLYYSYKQNNNPLLKGIEDGSKNIEFEEVINYEKKTALVSSATFGVGLLTMISSIGVGFSFICINDKKMEKQVKTLENKLKSNVEK